MASAQKRGFRLPWGGDAPQDDLDGEGSSTAAVADPDGEAGDGADLDATLDEDVTDEQSDQADEAVESRLATMTGGRAARAAAPDASDDVATEATAPARKPANPSRPGITAGWPDSDRRRDAGAQGRDGASARPAVQAPAAAAAPRRNNPLVAGLLRAMREAATVARDETIAGYRTEVAARVEAVRTEGAAATANLRTTSDNDIVGIREWGKAEMARIRQETEVRIAQRREQLSVETDAQAEATEAMLGVLRQAVSDFETEMAAFFEQLVVEEDPARVAGLAEQMPMPPSLEAFPEPEATSASKAKASRNGRAPAGVIDDAAETETADADASADEPDETEPEADDSDAAADGEADAEGLDSEAAAEAEAEAIAGLAMPPVPTQSQLMVVGLATVPAIAAFKAELMRVEGVTGVNVTAVADGEFMFTVAHAADTDLRSAVDAMDRFNAHVTDEDGATLSISIEESKN